MDETVTLPRLPKDDTDQEINCDYYRKSKANQQLLPKRAFLNLVNGLIEIGDNRINAIGGE